MPGSVSAIDDLRLSEQQANDCVCLAKYDFLLVFRIINLPVSDAVVEL